MLFVAISDFRHSAQQSVLMSIGHSTSPKNPNSDNGQGEHVSQEWRSCYQYYNLVDLAFEQLDAAYMQPVGNINKLPMQKLSVSRTIKEPGYMYIYISNEVSVQQDVFFDDLRVTHVKSPVIETNDYYPFGLTFNSYQRENSVRQSYKFQEKEWQDELDLNLYDFEWRQYDPIIARATTPDPHADSYFGLSPYSFFANNPINTLDPNGMDTIPVNQVNPRTINPEEDVILLDEVVVTASSENSDNSDA